MKTTVFSILVLCGLSALAGAGETILTQAIWNPDNYLMNVDEESSDPMRLLYGAMYYFHKVNEAGSRFDSDDMKRSLTLVEKAHRVSRRRDPEITTMYALISLWSGGKSKGLRNRIRYATQGINAFDTAKSFLPNNFELRALRMISFVEVPSSFKNLTSIMIEDGMWYMGLDTTAFTPEEKAVWDRYRPPVAVVLAESMRRQKDKTKLLAYLDMVSPEGMEDSAFSGVKIVYDTLVKKYR